ncbi:hypothetical protein L484_015532 [Morus notabilis]|uniref:Uncharacterized protein n=1 Tax=Morus notabilis TaxID=981085 RepID=W9RUM2_9ROSA|nr:hypothetical protein L484_015532 [Morus notabilis]
MEISRSKILSVLKLCLTSAASSYRTSSYKARFQTQLVKSVPMSREVSKMDAGSLTEVVSCAWRERGTERIVVKKNVDYEK